MTSLKIETSSLRRRGFETFTTGLLNLGTVSRRCPMEALVAEVAAAIGRHHLVATAASVSNY
jgi:hypothetical protein